MADSWEDWETEEPVVPGVPAAPAAAAAASKFEDEDQGEEEEPKWKANVPQTQQARAGGACAGGSGGRALPPPAVVWGAELLLRLQCSPRWITAAPEPLPNIIHALRLPFPPACLQAKEKKGLAKYDESKGARSGGGGADDTPLDDPIAEKLRQQRLIEEADYQATMELFGSGAPRRCKARRLSWLVLGL